MQHQVLVGEAFGLPGVVQGIEGHAAVVHGDEDGLSLRCAAEGHMVPQPALHPPPLVVVAAGALFGVVIPALEAVYVEIAHVVADLFEAFDQLAVGHAFTSFDLKVSML